MALLIPLLMVGLVICSGFFSASETAFFSLSREARRRLRSARGPAARLVVSLLENPQELLITILFGNMLVSTLYFSMSAMMAMGQATGWQTAGVGAASLAALILFGEVLPKSFSIHIPERMAVVAAVPLYFFHVAILPVRKVLGGIARAATYQSPARGASRYVTADELKMLVDLSAEKGVIDRAERDMIEEVVELGSVRVKDVMVPRVDAVCFDGSKSIAEFRDLARHARHKEIPVYEGTPDNIVGIARTRDVLLAKTGDLPSLLRPPRFVPETALVERVLRMFRFEKEHLAVAVDEYGGVAGLVTLEDIIEEIVGDIRDEFAPSPGVPVQRIGPGRYRLAGTLSIRDWADLFDIRKQFPHFDTLAGLVIFLIGRVPKEGDTARYENLTFTVEKVRRRRIVSIFVEMRGPLAPPQRSGGLEGGRP